MRAKMRAATGALTWMSNPRIHTGVDYVGHASL